MISLSGVAISAFEADTNVMPFDPDTVDAVAFDSDGTLYGQRALSETISSVIKRTLGDAMRARSWYREFRELILMCAVYNIKRAVS
ncbi:ISH9-type transposase [Natrialba aegyptia DSM 13077]|uniref:ISH9-type transposase n=1 Tax=Natrialba aegyptia DSM 13077 TaxID=1227491 RepID=M0AXK0_9EURY|nr:ISH9-type transposase [Natrialba aegyptia DSM 13077]